MRVEHVIKEEKNFAGVGVAIFIYVFLSVALALVIDYFTLPYKILLVAGSIVVVVWQTTHLWEPKITEVVEHKVKK